MQRHFYATKDDLLPVFERVESKRSLAYVRTGVFESSQLSQLHAGKDIPTLESPSPHPNAIAGYSYLVTPADLKVVIRPVQQNASGPRYAIDQLENPISIVFTHGGFFKPNILLYGRVATCSTHPTAKSLFRAYASAIDKCFGRIRAFYVGQNAADLLRQGCRLTIGADSPSEYDLA